MPMRIYYLTLFFVLIHSSCFSAPTVSTVSTYYDGLSVTIIGANFGANASPNPLFFDDFDSNDTGRQVDDTIKGDNASDYGAWLSGTPDVDAVYSDQNQRTNSALSHSITLTENGASNLGDLILDTGGHQSTLLISMWTRCDFTEVAGDSNWQFKTWRVNETSVLINDLNVPFQELFWQSRPAGARAYYEFFLGDVAPLVNPDWPATAGTDPTLDHGYECDGTWQNQIVFYKASSDGTTDGSMIIYFDGTEIENTSAMETWASTENFQYIAIGHYLGTEAWTGTSLTVTGQWDDVFVDDTWQSVWIGDADTWAGCTQREIQIPTAWADGEITFTANTGSFAEGEQLYLYVVDSTGMPNTNGYDLGILGAETQITSQSVTKNAAGPAIVKGTGGVQWVK